MTGTYRFLTLLLCAIAPLSAALEIAHIAPPTAQQHYFLIMKGAYEQSRRNYSDAATTFAMLSPHVTSPQMTVAQWLIAFEQGNFDTLVRDAQRITAEFPTNHDLQLKLAQAFLNTHRVSDAIGHLLWLRTRFPHRERINYFAAMALLKQQRFVEAQEIITTALDEKNRTSKQYLFHFLNAKSAFLQGQYEAALTHIHACTRAHQTFSRVQVLEGLIHEKMGNTPAALRSYNTYLQHTTDADIEQKYVSLAFAAQRYDLVREVLEKKPLDTSTYYHDLGLVYFKLGDAARAHELIEKSLCKNPRFTKARTLKIHVLAAQRDTNEIQSCFISWLRETPGDVELIRTIMKLGKKGLSRAQVCGIIREVARDTPNTSLCFALGDLLHEAEQYDEAREWYEKALSVTLASSRVQSVPLDSGQARMTGLTTSKLLFQIARTHFMQGNLSAMHRSLDAAEQCSPVYPSVYNLRAAADQAAPEALALVQKALHSDANNEAYLRTKRALISQ